jgi:hypothetical protein
MQKRPPTQAKENAVASAAIASPSPSSTLKETAPPKAASRPNNRSAMAKPQPKATAPKKEVKVRRDKKVKFSFTMHETEHDAVVELKHKLSDAMGSKVKKSDLIRVALQLLQSQPQAKIKAGIVKLYGPTTTDSQNV